MTDSTKGDPKPITSFAPPPLSAIFSVAAMVGISVYYFPTIPDPDASIFVYRVFPQYLSVTGLIWARLFFVFVCVVGFASGWMTPA
jgi:hypothetical protein